MSKQMQSAIPKTSSKQPLTHPTNTSKSHTPAPAPRRTSPPRTSSTRSTVQATTPPRLVEAPSQRCMATRLLVAVRSAKKQLVSPIAREQPSAERESVDTYCERLLDCTLRSHDRHALNVESVLTSTGQGKSSFVGVRGQLERGEEERIPLDSIVAECPGVHGNQLALAGSLHPKSDTSKLSWLVETLPRALGDMLQG